ncbi:hypothetical protein IQ277_12035 [Nostocales cyanobacterium LEGE 12452]|nr:hypothetical protein [Nostocales cyanobacterium LEGE 12452]
MCIHNLFLTPTRKINPALRHRHHHRRDFCTGGHRHHHRRDFCTGGHRHHHRDVCIGGHRHHRRDVCTGGHRHHRRDVCTGDRDYPILHHVVSACHRLYF